MKKNNVYKLNENEEVKFDVYISDKRALSTIQEIPKENLSKFLSQSLKLVYSIKLSYKSSSRS